MQIQLTQDEIKEAVRHYVTSALGINLSGKTLTTTFTATRGEAGIVATLVLQKAGDADAVEIPGFTNAPDEVIAAANTASAATEVVTEAKAPASRPAAEAKVKAMADKGTPAPVTTAALAPAADTATTAAAVAQTEPVQAAAAEDVQVAEAAAVVVEDTPKTTTSLFG